MLCEIQVRRENSTNLAAIRLVAGSQTMSRPEFQGPELLLASGPPSA